MKKRLLGFFCFLALTAALALPAAAATTFSDVKSEHWAYESISSAAERGMINGYPDGTFRPAGTVSSAEVGSVIYKGFFNSTPAAEADRVYYADVPKGHWAYEILATAGLVMMPYYYESHPNIWYIYPDAPMSRESVAFTIGYVAYRSTVDASVTAPPTVPQSVFKDYDDVYSKVRPYLDFAVQEKLINGYPDGTFRPDGDVSRAEFATLAVRLKDYLAK